MYSMETSVYNDDITLDKYLTKRLDEGVSYIEIAAEIGNLLLERNENLLLKLQTYEDKLLDKDMKITMLTKQSVSLQQINEMQWRDCDQLENNCRSLQEINEELNVENKNKNKDIVNLKNNIRNLEMLSENYKAKISILHEKLRKSEIKVVYEEKVVEVVRPCNINLDDYVRSEVVDEYKNIIEHLETDLKNILIKYKALEDQLSAMELSNVSAMSKTSICNCKEHLTMLDYIEEDDSVLESVDCFFNGVDYMSTPPKKQLILYGDEERKTTCEKAVQTDSILKETARRENLANLCTKHKFLRVLRAFLRQVNPVIRPTQIVMTLLPITNCIARNIKAVLYPTKNVKKK
ncbi:PREDICTED: uncharacterized protein LOC108561630 [Nicrophorus vespilloides]|uniref:Uncharacterized protein LOC108561630 n=1 Tax=Nicrophorus vespilloides TaxID=110193 RepID=A0ABM1MKP6_NICVS|nr:PREDICTED: uncharacterized protein LOC108561630 [Nicrophorus vespilloides]XP_017775146.1 PREDICTED: uncharacterized protein LOC108561630 [Nicrophorus vespilloides]XP_017775147.1 PREDICTED: uncharacterized protein LOC108561630 [Nicrophorus vespilloides]